MGEEIFPTVYHIFQYDMVFTVKESRAQSPFLPDFQMTSSVRKLNRKEKHPSFPVGMRGKS